MLKFFEKQNETIKKIVEQTNKIAKDTFKAK